MAKEYIEREAAIEETRKPRITDAELRRRLALIPAADVAPVIRARWISRVYDGRSMNPICSHCTWPADNVLSETKYCPHCGAYMWKV